jgi:hypothetical protein
MEELKKILLIGARVGTIGGEVVADGKVDLKDLPELFKVIGEARKLTEIDYEKACEQLKNLTSEQRAELNIEFSKEFDLPSDQLEQRVEKIVNQSLGLISYILKLIDSCKDVKKIS